MKRFLLWFDARRLATGILFVALFAMAVRTPADTDTWWHLQAGRVTLESGRVLQTDLFSHTRAGSRWINHSWLSQVVLYWLFDHFSYAGLGLWMGGVVVVSFVFVHLQMEGDPFTRAFILVLAAAVSAVIWVARPQLLSFLLTAVVAYILHLFKWRGVNRLWLLPPIFILWVNLHAGYALGFMLLVAFVSGELFNHLASLVVPGDDPVIEWRGIGVVIGFTLLSALALVINPNSTRMWTYYLDTVKISALQDYIQEWRSPDFHPLYTQPFIWMLLATLAAVGLSGRRVDGTDLAMVGGFAYAALLAGRNFGPFALVSAPVLSRHVAAILSRCRQTPGRRWFARPRRRLAASTRTALGAVNLWLLVLLCVLAAVKVWTPLSATFNEQARQESLPVDAATWIRQNRPPGQMFNPYNWGGYLIWALWPDYRVFVDGRTDLFGDEILRDYLAIQTASPSALTLLDEHQVSFVLTGRDGPLSMLLACQEDWLLAYQDDLTAVWRTSGR